jgi:cytosine/adenosine deaminase-related metal-dependent hydrolase
LAAVYLQNATWIDWQGLGIHACHVEVEAGPQGNVRLIDSIPAEARAQGADIVDCSGKLVTRSFVVGHHHIYSALARGMPQPSRPPQSFNDILALIWWNLDKQLDADMIRASALATAIEAARCGSTFLIDHHASPHAAADSLHLIGAALEEVGLGHLLCYELSDRDGPERMQEGLQETRAWLQEHQGLVGLHASFTVSDTTLRAAIDLAKEYKTGIHIHVAEAKSDQEAAEQQHGKRIVERLQAAGVLASSRSLLVHCLHLSDAERDLIHNSPAWVVHNPQSNQNNAVGGFDATALGDRILLGTDGMHSDMLSSTNAAYLESQSHMALSPLQAYTRLRRAHDYLATNEFEGDGDNNLVVLDYRTPTPVTSNNWPAHVVYALQSRHVSDVLSQGRWVVRDRQVVRVDEERCLAQAQEQAARLWKKL